MVEDPHPPGSEKPSDQERNRVRQGIYRIIYKIKNEEFMVVVVKVGHRRKVYYKNG